MLTDTKLRSLKLRDSAYRIADTSGLCIEVRSTGAKVWRYSYRFAGKVSIVTMAEYPAMALSEVRLERDKLRALVKGGANRAQVARIDRATKVELSETTFPAIAPNSWRSRRRKG